MFYEEEEISQHLKCQYCRKMFVDPRILECGESMCYSCIMLFLNKEKTGLNCIICNEFHDIPKNGFIKSRGLANLVEIKSNEVSRSKEASDLKTELNTIHEKTSIIESDLKMGKSKIREHCDFVRNDVEVKVESWHQYIDKFHGEFKNTIDKYEEESLETFETSGFDKSDYEQFIQETNKFHTEWSGYLKKFQIDDQQLKSACKQAKEISSNIKIKAEDLKYRIFNNRLLSFKENEESVKSSIIGQIEFKNIKSSSEIKEKLDLKAKLNEFKDGNKINVGLLQNGNFVIAFESTTNNVNILILDRQGNVLNQKSSLIHDTPIGSKNYYYFALKVSTFKDSICLYIDLDCQSSGKTTHAIKIFDLTLILKTEINLGFVLKDFTIFNNNLFILSFRYGSYGTISNYDENLRNIENIGQNNVNLPYFFASSIEKIQVNENFYFLLIKKQEINIMNKNDGFVVTKFFIYSKNICLYSNQYIITLDSLSKVYFHDFKGKLENERKIDNLTSNHQLIGTSDEKLIFFDPITLTLNIYHVFNWLKRA